MYRFDWQFPCFDGAYALHGGEIPFVFGTLNYLAPAWDEYDSPQRREAADPAGTRYTLAKNMQQAWAAFAREGNPSHAGLPDWPNYTSAQRQTMILGTQCRMLADPESKRREIATRLLSSCDRPVRL